MNLIQKINKLIFKIRIFLIEKIAGEMAVIMNVTLSNDPDFQMIQIQASKIFINKNVTIIREDVFLKSEVAAMIKDALKKGDK